MASIYNILTVFLFLKNFPFTYLASSFEVLRYILVISNFIFQQFNIYTSLAKLQ